MSGWERLYGAGGMLQHQSFVPGGAAREVFARLLRMSRGADLVPWLAVLKRHRADRFVLTHNLDGWSLALDFRVTRSGRERLVAHCRAMDEVVLAEGGRFYAAKDQTALPGTFRASVPRMREFEAWRARLDPRGTLTTALWERISGPGSDRQQTSVAASS